MSVNTVSTGRLPFYGPLSGNGSPNAKSAGKGKAFPEETRVETDLALVTPAATDGEPQSQPAPADDSNAGQFGSALDQALQQGRTTASLVAGNPASSSLAAEETHSGQPSPGIEVYRRISQYGNNESATSELVKRWNSIMLSGKSADAATADFAKALARNETSGLDAHVVDLTA